MRVLREELKRSTEQKGRRNLIDTKGLGKPSPFSGQIAEWEAWSFKLVTWMGAQFGEAERIPERASALQGAITEEVVEDLQLNYSRTPVREFNSQLYGGLVSLLDLGSEPVEIVRNSVKGMGLDAWRRLCGKYDPTTHRQTSS